MALTRTSLPHLPGLDVLAVVLAIIAPFAHCYADGPRDVRLVRDKYGAIVRGDVNQKQLALVFTGDERGESLAPILETLRKRKVPAGFFVTGNFLRQPKLNEQLKQAVAEGHYLGPHSDAHPLYCPWDDREESLVTRWDFTHDLQKNIAELKSTGGFGHNVQRLFIAPYEWYNADQVQWSKKLGVTLFNFTPGSGSNRDYAPEGDKVFVPSQKIYDDILAYEQKDPHGLNGFILLLHLGSGRQDPFHPRLGLLCDELKERGYELVRIDELLSDTESR